MKKRGLREMTSFAGHQAIARFSARALSTISFALLVPVAADAADVTISNSRTTPIESATADGSSAGNVQINDGGSVTVSTGPAVTLNSDNTFINLGTVEVTSSNGAVGVRIEGGHTGSFSSSGIVDAVVLDDDDVAIGTGNIAVWVTGSSSFIGNISFEEGSSAAAGGTNAVMLAIETGVTGDIYVDGYLSTLGTNATTINVLASVDGNITLGAEGTLYASGEGTRVLFIDAPLSGALNIGGAVTISGLQSNVDYDPDDDGVYNYPMAEFGIGIAASLGNGFETTTDAVLSATYTYTGVLISPAIATTPADITLGIIDPGTIIYGFWNQGNISATAGIEGSNITALRIEGFDNGSIYTTYIESGMLNAGSINANAYRDATATAISFGTYASTPALVSDGTISAYSSGAETASAYAVLIESGASLPSINNTSSLSATAYADDAYAYGIVDLSGTLLNVTNSGTMLVSATSTADVDNPGDDDVDGDVGDGARVVIVLDLSYASGATTIANSGSITGTTLLSDQNDTLTLSDDGDATETTWSAWNGLIEFAGGDDTFTLSGAGVFTGSITKTSGTLAIDVQDATLGLGREDYITATTVDFGAGSQLTLEITPANSATARLTATDRITFADGAQVRATMVEFGSVNLTSILARAPLIDASAVSSLVVQDISFLYSGETTLVDGAVEDELILSLHLKSAAELNFTGNNAAFYDSVMDILGVADNALAEPFLALSTEEEFMSAYEALMPRTSQPMLRGAIALSDSIERAHEGRTAALLSGDSSLDGFNAWWSGTTQKILVGSTEAGPGINGDLVAVTYGAEGMLTPFGAIGASFTYGSSTMLEDGTDDRLRFDSTHAGAYAAFAAGPFFANGAIGIGKLSNRSDRRFETDDYSLRIEHEWDATTTDASLQGGLNVQLAKIIFRPWAGMSWLNVSEDAHAENRGNTGFDLAYDETDIDVRRAKAGLSILFAGGNARAHVLPELRASYSRLLSDNPTTLTGSFVDGAVPFVLSTIPLAEEELSAGFGLDIVAESVVFGFNYDATLGDGDLTHGGELHVSLQF